MPPRKRSKGRENWPKNLKAKDVKGNRYYFWVNPDTRKEESLQCPNDFKQAVSMVNELNSWFFMEKENDKVKQILANKEAKKVKSSITIAECLEIYIEHCISLKQAANTINVKRSRVNNINKHIGDVEIMQLTVAQTDEVIQAQIIGKSTSNAVSVRSTLIDMYTLAKSKGLVHREFVDPASTTLKPKYKSTKARLTFEDFKIINDLSKKDRLRPWIYRCQLMAILTGQRLDDINRIRFKKGANYQKIWDEWIDGDKQGKTPYSYVDDDYLFIIQKKTKALIKFDLDLSIDKVGFTIRQVVNMCRDRTMSKYLFHHFRTRHKAVKGQRVSSNTMTRSFSHYRDKSNLDWGNRKKPTFHEMRAVSAALHEEQGRVAKDILGHKNQTTTDLYLDPKGTCFKLID